MANHAPSGTVKILKPATEFLVNSTTSGDQSWQSMAKLLDGGWLSTWTSTDQDGSGTGVYAQRYTASGKVTGGEFRINSITSGDQLAPAIAGLPDGGWLATWTSYDPSNPAGDIHAQRYDAAGNLVSIEIVINATTPLMQDMSKITVLADGGWVITWNSEAQDGSGFGIFGKRFDSDGSQIGSEFQVNTYTAGDQTWPEIASLADGGWVIAWMSDGQDGSGRGVFAQRFGSDGSRVDTEFLVNTQTYSVQEAPRLAALPDGGWVITWQSYNQDGSSSGIYGQRYAASGARAGTEFQINTYTNDQQIESSVTALEEGGLIVTWTSQGQDNPVGGTYTRGGIYGQRYASDGTMVGPEFQINTNTADSQYRARVISLASGGWVVNWISDYQDGSGTGLYGQQFAANGLPQATVVGSDLTQGRTLYADASQVTDADGVGTIAWHWQRSNDNGTTWSDVSGATGSSYTLAQADVGKLVRSKVSYVDGGGTLETVFSAASTAIAGLGSSSGSTITGNSGVDTLTGDEGDDVINGLGGVDSMDGAGGSDIYIITGSSEHKAAEIHDSGATGTDEVRFSAAKSDTLKIFAGDTGIERVVIGTGTTALANSAGTLSLNIDASKAVNGLTIIGNAGVNKLTGTAFNDTIDGGLGADRMTGGAGDDTYIVDNVKDAISEKATGGTDTAMSLVGYTLASTVENLTLTGSGDISGTGNKLNNTIVGNSGNNTLAGAAGDDTISGGAGSDTLNGGLGNDTLTGGAGADMFVFNTKPNAALNVDVITDFSSSNGDHLQFSVKLFKGLGTVGDLSSDQFWSGAGVRTAHDATDRIIYNTSTGDVYYDADGSGTRAVAILVAQLAGNPALAFGDIQIIA